MRRKCAVTGKLGDSATGEPEQEVAAKASFQGTGVDDRGGEGLGRFLRYVVSDAAEDPVGVRPPNLFAQGAPSAFAPSKSLAMVMAGTGVSPIWDFEILKSMGARRRQTRRIHEAEPKTS